MRVPDAQACAVLRPAVAEAARLAGAGPVGLVDVGGGRPGTAANLRLDDVVVDYGEAGTSGDGGSTAQVACRVVGGCRVPTTPLPPVVARVAVPVTADLARTLPAAVAGIPPDALVVVLTTWSLSRLAPARRPGLVGVLERAAAARPLAWVSVEGVAVAPTVPTLGDRPASGHSLVGLVLPGVADAHVLARCWSRGAVLAWLGGTGS